MEYSRKLDFIYSLIFIIYKKIYRFQLCLKAAASLFPFSWMTFLIQLEAHCFKNNKIKDLLTWLDLFITNDFLVISLNITTIMLNYVGVYLFTSSVINAKPDSLG